MLGHTRLRTSTFILCLCVPGGGGGGGGGHNRVDTKVRARLRFAAVAAAGALLAQLLRAQLDNTEQSVSTVDRTIMSIPFVIDRSSAVHCGGGHCVRSISTLTLFLLPLSLFQCPLYLPV